MPWLLVLGKVPVEREGGRPRLRLGPVVRAKQKHRVVVHAPLLEHGDDGANLVTITGPANAPRMAVKSASFASFGAAATHARYLSTRTTSMHHAPKVHVGHQHARRSNQD